MSITLNRFRNNFGIDRYLHVHVFTTDVSKSLIDAANGLNNSSLYFDDSGSLALRTFDNKLVRFTNDMTGRDVEITMSNIVKVKHPGDKFVYSAGFGAWFLYLDPIVGLYYNPIPRPEYIAWFKQDPINAMNLAIDACIENGSADPVCSCLNRQTESLPDTEICMNEIFGNDPDLRKSIKHASKNAVGYNQLEEICGCANVACKKEHPFVLEYRRTGGGHECGKDIKINICNTTFTAGGNISFAGDVQAQCENDRNPVPIEPPHVDPPTPAPVPGTDPVPPPPIPVPPQPPTPPPQPPSPKIDPTSDITFMEWIKGMEKKTQILIVSGLVALSLLFLAGLKQSSITMSIISILGIAGVLFGMIYFWKKARGEKLV